MWGVDGCPGGWFAVSNHGDLILETDFSGLLKTADKGRFYVDMPIGLPDSKRHLERIARSFKAVRSGSIFPVPCRRAVYAECYESACEINLLITGKKLSKQSWFLCKKIKQIDVLLRQETSLRDRVIESHPELAYSFIGKGLPLRSKKTREGVVCRLELLSQRHLAVWDLFTQAKQTFPRKVLGLDDIVDALILMTVGTGRKKCLVWPTQRQDSYGIPIRMIVPA